MKSLRVLVPLDGSALAEAILPIVRGLQASHVTLLRVAERRPFGTEPDAPRERGPAAERDIAWTAERLQLEGFKEVAPLVREGKPAEEILAAAADVGAGLIAMTTHGRTGFERLVLGSVAEKVIRAAEIPVLALRTPEPAPPDAPPIRPLARVLVPCDGSVASWRAIETLALLDDARAAKLEILGVVETYAGPTALPSEPSRDLVVEFQRLRRDGLLHDVERAVAHARALGFEAEARVQLGVPAAEILDRAEALPASLIAMATHGRSGPSRWALGSVTEKVLRGSRVPLLICK